MNREATHEEDNQTQSLKDLIKDLREALMTKDVLIFAHALQPGAVPVITVEVCQKLICIAKSLEVTNGDLTKLNNKIPYPSHAVEQLTDTWKLAQRIDSLSVEPER